MGLGEKGNRLKQEHSLGHKPVGFDSRHPNRTYLQESSDTAFGDLVKLGDTVHVELEVPIEAKVQQIYKKPNGKTYMTGVLRNENVETWPMSIVHLGPLPKAQVENEQPPDIGWDWAVEKGFMTQKQEEGLLQYVKEHPGAADRIYTPQKGTIRKWHVDDPLTNHGRILYFTQTLLPPVGRKIAVIQDSRSERGIFLDEMWKHIPDSGQPRAQGREKTWFKRNHVQWRSGGKLTLGEIQYFVIGESPRKMYAIVQLLDEHMNKRVIDQPDPYKLGLEPVLRLLAVDELYKHKIDHHSSSLLYQKKQSLSKKSPPPVTKPVSKCEETDPETRGARGAPETIRTRVSARSRGPVKCPSIAR